MSKILFTNNRLTNTKYNMTVKENEKGHFHVVLGAVNAKNNQNETYIDQGLDKLLSEGGYLSVAHKLQAGLMGGEAMHPRRTPGMTDAQWMHRNLQIDTLRQAYVIHTIETKQTTLTEAGCEKPVTLLEGWIECDDSDVGNKLRARLRNKNVNVTFSIRCFARETFPGSNIWYITKIITFDWVDIPGMSYASKNGTDGLVLKTEDGQLLRDIEAIGYDVPMTTDLVNELNQETDGLKTESAQHVKDISRMIEMHDSDEGFVFSKW